MTKNTALEAAMATCPNLAAYPETALRLVVLTIPAVAVLSAMVFTGGSIGGVGPMIWSFEFKPLRLFYIMSGYSFTLSAASVSVLIGFLYVAGKRRILKLTSRALDSDRAYRSLSFD